MHMSCSNSGNMSWHISGMKAEYWDLISWSWPVRQQAPLTLFLKQNDRDGVVLIGGFDPIKRHFLLSDVDVPVYVG